MIVTISGSMRHYRLMCLLQDRLMSKVKNMIVFSPCIYKCVLYGKDTNDLSPIEDQNLLDIHLKKIDISDILLVIDYNMGQGTYNEKMYAIEHNIPVVHMSEIIKYFNKDKEIMDLIKSED